MKNLLMLILVSFCGCSSVTGTNDIPVVNTAQFSDAGIVRKAVIVGLTAVDPKSYDGWAGDCPGCDVDANSMFAVCSNTGISAELLYNEKATWLNVRASISQAASSLRSNDLLIIFMSGHGGQVADDNGDEEDGLDETICLGDGQVRDDKVLELIQTFPSGLRVVLINDQCHSEGNFRSFTRALQRTVSVGYWGRKQGKPLIKISRKDAKTAKNDIRLIQFAGCREASYSYGAEDGGTWTQALLATLSSDLSWQGWFKSAQKKMPSNQVPVWVEYGNVTDFFRNGQALK